MIKILGVNYITQKEAASRYGFSSAWFEGKRHKEEPPNYIKISGKVLYDVNKTDEWFKNNMKKTDYV